MPIRQTIESELKITKTWEEKKKKLLFEYFKSLGCFLFFFVGNHNEDGEDKCLGQANYHIGISVLRMQWTNETFKMSITSEKCF